MGWEWCIRDRFKGVPIKGKALAPAGLFWNFRKITESEKITDSFFFLSVFFTEAHSAKFRNDGRSDVGGRQRRFLLLQTCIPSMFFVMIFDF